MNSGKMVRVFVKALLSDQLNLASAAFPQVGLEIRRQEGGVQAATVGEALSAEEMTEGEQGHTDF